MEDPYRKLSRSEASDAVTRLGWRLVLGELRTEVRTGSLALAADVAARAATVAGAEGHLRLDVRADRVLLSLQTATAAWVTERIPNTELIIFEDCAHAPIYENVEGFNAQTLAFLQRHVSS